MKEKPSKEKTSLSNSNSWVKIYRKFLQWEWYDDINTKVVFLHILLKANYKDKKWHGILIKRGSFITSLNTLFCELNTNPKTNRLKKTGIITKMNIRTALKHLILTQEITQQTTSNYTLITVNNYDAYQTPNIVSNTRLTHDQHTTNTRLTTTIEGVEEIEYTHIGDKPQKFGNSDITKLQTVLKEHYPIPLEGITDRRRLYNIIQVLTKRKNQDEWMGDTWKANLNTFMSLYLKDTKEEYYARSVYKLLDKIKLWREYRGKLN